MTGRNKMPSKEELEARLARNREAARERAKSELAYKLLEGQLMLWPESERGVPNELVRCSVFNARNRNEPRLIYKASAPLEIAIVGGGRVAFWGEELRQDDETVWMQLVHMAKDARKDTVEFKRHALLKEMRWPINGQSYTRLLNTLRRLSTAGLEIYSKRFDKGINVRLVDRYEYSEDENTLWRVKVFDTKEEALKLFDQLYSRVEWAQRLELPDGVATWLHSFYASHREPFPHKLTTLALGAGMILERPEDNELDAVTRKRVVSQRMKDARKTMKSAHDALVKTGFLKGYDIRKGADKAVIIEVERNNRDMRNVPLY